MTSRGTFEADVRDHLTICRRTAPIPSRESLSPKDEAQCQVLGGHLIHWLSEWGPQLLQERAVLSSLRGWDPEPLICFHSDWPGLIAASEVLRDNSEQVVWGRTSDFESLPTKDNEFTHHVELHSTFLSTIPKSIEIDALERHPLIGSEVYLLHRDESILGPLFARSAYHLWKWDGHELTLLEEAFETWTS